MSVLYAMIAAIKGNRPSTLRYDYYLSLSTIFSLSRTAKQFHTEVLFVTAEMYGNQQKNHKKLPNMRCFVCTHDSNK